jgi:hypothetical protein
MIKQMESSGNSEGKQLDLRGRTVEQYHAEHLDDEQVGLLKSALQKCTRQGYVEKAMHFALKLAGQNWWSCWKRLSTIADEDCGQPLEIVAVDTLMVCPVCGRDGFVQQRGNSCRIGHYVGYKNGVSIIEWHRVASECLVKTDGKDGNELMVKDKSVERSFLSNKSRGWELNPYIAALQAAA